MHQHKNTHVYDVIPLRGHYTSRKKGNAKNFKIKCKAKCLPTPLSNSVDIFLSQSDQYSSPLSPTKILLIGLTLQP